MSERSCSAASSVFFEAVAVPDQPARQRGGSHLNTGRASQLSDQLGHGEVVLLGHPAQQKRTMRLELGMTAATARLRCKATGLAIVPHQDDDERNRYSKMCRSRVSRMAGINVAHNTFTQIE